MLRELNSKLNKNQKTEQEVLDWLEARYQEGILERRTGKLVSDVISTPLTDKIQEWGWRFENMLILNIIKQNGMRKKRAISSNDN